MHIEWKTAYCNTNSNWSWQFGIWNPVSLSLTLTLVRASRCQLACEKHINMHINRNNNLWHVLCMKWAWAHARSVYRAFDCCCCSWAVSVHCKTRKNASHSQHFPIHSFIILLSHRKICSRIEARTHIVWRCRWVRMVARNTHSIECERVREREICRRRAVFPI